MAMAARPQTPVQDAYSIPHPNETGALIRGYSTVRSSSSRPSSYAGPGSAFHYNNLDQSSQPAHNPRFKEDFEAASRRSSVLLDGPSGGGTGVQRSASLMSPGPSSRSGTLRKKASLSKKGSLRRNGSRRSMRAGSVRSLSLGDREKYHSDGIEDANSAFMVPIPTTGNPTEVLANRFQAWRKILKDLIIFFKEVQKSYETRSKLFLSASHVMNNQVALPSFLQSGGLADATEILQHFHRQGYTEANKAVEVEIEVISQLTGLRSDLQKKTKEIKNLSGDFKNTVEKEIDGTRKAVHNLHESLGLVDTDPSATSGKGDPFLMRLNVERQVEKQIEEENYLHRAYLNLENSGRELESIVVSEIQKAYNAYASILKREADEAYDTVEKLRAGPISMPQDHEWNAFVASTDELVDPRIPLRNVENITYDGKDHPAAAEVRAGMLERKSKYLKSYTPGWYVLSPTHLHEFKSADRVEWQTPVMSLYLPEQKLGSHSQGDSSSHKFMLKGRQTGAMHRGHSWVFRAESHETMMSWYEDIESLSNKTGEARNAFVRRHVRSVSGRSTNSEVLEDDEADQTPYSAESVVLGQERPTSATRQPGGAFPSDVQIDRHLQAPLSPSSGDSSVGRDMIVAASVLPEGDGAAGPSRFYGGRDSATASPQPTNDDGSIKMDRSLSRLNRHDSYYGDWIGPTAIVAQQKKSQLSEAANTDAREIRSDGDHNSVAAMSGVLEGADRRESSAPPQVARRESVSTVPTNTNGTDYTNNTMATSVDETPHFFKNGAAVASGSLPAPNYEDGYGAAGSAKAVPDLSLPKRDSVVAIDMKIPGRYPPTNVAA
ncbi:PH domain protein [Penicillium brasilianum]|uniref:PH domain protein n=1 Tax=Penicillium brasilianum TaxID=104259 RepID=A0A1S9RA17_PENBI|nr:PH domain protein [Penicillium brasilianum]